MHDLTTAKTHAYYRADIDGLRAVAVLSVMISHAVPSAMRGGFVGVDVFFVISGFLITGNILTGLENGKFSILDFYGRRIRRLFPALIVVLCFVWVAAWMILLGDDFKVLGKHIAASAAFVPNIVFWRDLHMTERGVTTEIILHLWSLGVEEQYYLVWPLFLLIVFARRTVTIVLTLALLLLSFGLNIFFTFDLQEAAFYLPFPRFWELLVGGLLAFAAKASPASSNSNITLALITDRTSQAINDAKSWCGLVLIMAACFILSKQHSFPGFWVLLPTTGAALLIAAGPAAAVNRVVLNNRAMVAIGLISYPLYLWHWPLLSFTEYAWDDKLDTVQRLLIVFAAFPLAWLTYRFAERPLRYASQQRAIVTTALTIAMALMFALGLWTYSMNGFPWRLLP